MLLLKVYFGVNGKSTPTNGIRKKFPLLPNSWGCAPIFFHLYEIYRKVGSSVSVLIILTDLSQECFCFVMVGACCSLIIYIWCNRGTVNIIR